MFSQTRTRSPNEKMSDIPLTDWPFGRGRQHTVPVGDVLVGDTGGNIEHDDTALAVDVVSISETSELLLTSGIPHIELNSTQVL